MRKYLALGAFLLVFPTVPAFAQEASEQTAAPVLEEIFVTARRRGEDLQRTPVAVSVMSAEDLTAYNVNNIGDVTRIVPGLDRYEGRKEASFAIRGIGRGRSTDNTLDPSIGVYIDGIFLPRHDSQLLDAVDIETIQVLRGPQGTLFGKNTIGGAILVTTREPGDVFGLSVDALVDSFNARDVQLSIDMPVIEDRLLTRLTLSKRVSDGFAEDVNSNNEVGNENRVLAIAQASANLADNLHLKLLAHYSDQDEEVEPYHCEFVTREGLTATARAPGEPLNYEEACRESERLSEDDKVNPENYGLSHGTDQLLIGATLKWELPFGELTSITTYDEKGPSVANTNFDGTEVLYLINRDYVEDVLRDQEHISGEIGSRWGWSQELQFSGEFLDSRLQYTTGVFVSRESIDKDLGGTFVTPEGYIALDNVPGVTSLPPGTLLVAGAAQGDVRSFDNESYAVFGQFTLDLTRSVQLTAGARYTEEERNLKAYDWFLANPVPPPAPGTTPIPGVPFAVMTQQQFDAFDGTIPDIDTAAALNKSIEFDNVSAMLSLAWNVTDRYELPSVSNLMTYITVAEGFKAGGFTTFFGELAEFEPETLISTEVGVKIDMFDRRMRMNLSVYDSDYTDMQMFVVRIDGNFGGDFGTTNAGESVVRGAELETTFLASQNLSISATASYNEAKFVEYDDFAVNRITGDIEPIDRSNEPFPFIPQWKYSLALNYKLPTESLGDFNFTSVTSYRDEIFMGQDFKAGLPRFIDQATANSYTITTLRATWIPFSDRSLMVSLFGNNVFDKDYIAWGAAVTDNLGTNGVLRGKPAHWGLEVKYTIH